LEQARSGYDMASVSLEQARDAHQKAMEGFQIVSGEIPAENVRRANDALAQAESQRESLLVNLEAARERLNDASVRSPISGHVSMRNVEPQTMLNQAAASFVVVNTNSVLVNVHVTEIIINKIETGQMVSVHINAVSDTPFIGEITIVSPAASEATLTFLIGISIDNTDGLIKPGMFAEVFFVREQADDVMVIPRESVLIDEGVPIVYTAENGRASRKEIETGIDSGYEIQILSGLSLGDELIVKGQTYIKDGTSIQVINLSAEAEAGGF
jgi:RND family efflux transporter MFP subunit